MDLTKEIIKKEDYDRMDWLDFLALWPEGAFHYLQDTQPEYGFWPWKELCLFAKYPPLRWYLDLAAQVIAREVDHEVFALWKGQRIEREILVKLSEKPDSIIEIMIVQGKMIYSLQGSLRSLVKEFPASFAYSQLAFLKMMCGFTDRVVVVPKKLAPEIRAVFIEVAGPRLQDMVSWEGVLDASFETVTTKEGIWMLSKAPKLERKEKIPVCVPDALKVLWLRRGLRETSKIDFLSAEYYSMSMESYSTWSFSLHQAQLKQVLNKVPRDVTVVAPGDGVGVCAKLWKGDYPVVSGDMVKTSWSQGVVQETFQETLCRGKEVKGRKLFVLSYVLSLMSKKDLEVVRQISEPMVFVEPKEGIVQLGLLGEVNHVGPGVWLRNCPVDWIEGVSVTESPMRVTNISFSENLLALPEISYFNKNMAVQYWQSLRPMSRAVQWEKGLSVPLVVMDLKEYSLIKEKIVGSSVYLASIGKFFCGEVEQLMVDVEMKISVREVYSVPVKSLVVDSLKAIANYAVVSDLLLFSFSQEGHFECRTSKAMYSLLVVKEKVVQRVVQFLGFRDQCYYLKVPRGELIIPKTPLNYELLRFYFQEFGLPLKYLGDKVEHMKLASRYKKILEEVMNNYEKECRDPNVSPAFWNRLQMAKRDLAWRLEE